MTDVPTTRRSGRKERRSVPTNRPKLLARDNRTVRVPPGLPTVVLGTFALALAMLAAGCVKAPAIVLTDQKTALEQQAAGDYHALENDLQDGGVAPKGEDIPRQTLEAENPDSRTSSLGEVVQLYSAVQSDAEWLDELLVAGCVGEGKDGLLVAISEPCNEDIDAGQLTRVIERSNLHRRQLWRLVRERTPGASEDKVRQTWRTHQLERVVCDGMIQGDDNSWGKKKC